MSVVHGQMAEWIKMPLGTEVGLSPGHTVLDGDPAPLRKGVQQPPPTLWLMSIVAKLSPISATAVLLLWPPYVIGGALYFCPVVSFYLSIYLSIYLSFFFFPSPNLSGHRLDVYHILSHGVGRVALVRI